MSKSLPKPEPSLLQKHLDRARDLGVELDEYAEVYNVNLEALIATANQPDLSDFVAVKMTSSSSPTTSVVLTLSNHCGQEIRFHDWPPAELLERLWRCAQ